MKSRSLAYGSLGLVLVLFGCKSGSGPSFIEVAGTSPAKGQQDVIVDTPVIVRMSEVIDPTTLTSDTFFLTDENGVRVPGTLSILEAPDIDPSLVGTAAQLTPEEALSVLTEFTATVTTELRSGTGLTLEEDFQWTFKTLDAAWGNAEWIEPLGDWVSRSQDIAVDEQLSAIAVWELDDRLEPTNSTYIYANRYTRGGLWGEPEPVDDGNGRATQPRVAMDGAGNGFAVWVRGDLTASGQRIWANRYDVEEGQWGTAALLQNGELSEVTRAKTPAVAADPSGNATAVWVQDNLDTERQIVRAIRYAPSDGWGDAVTIGSPNTLIAAAITDVGMDDQGGAIAIWDPPAGVAGEGVRVLWANRFAPGSGWGEPEAVKADETTPASGFRLDVGANGDAFAVWRQGNGSDTDLRDDIWAARLAEGSWGEPERIDRHDDGNKETPDIAVDGTGVAYAVWSQTGELFKNIWVAEYVPGSGWGEPVLIEPPNADPEEDGDATTPRVEVNRAGNVFVVWRQVWAGWPSAWSNRRDPRMSWSPESAERIEDFPESASFPKIVVDEGPHAHSVWIHGDSNGPKVRTNRFE